MKTFSTTLIALAAASTLCCLPGVNAHGHMTSPTIRPINAKYRADALFGLRGAGDDELELAPLELLRGRGQADQPAAPTFDIMNGCRGIEYQPGGPTTTVTPGQQLPVTWMIQAPHPGYMELYIVKASKDASGKVMYKQDGAALKRIDNFATGGGTGSTTVTLPTNLSGCGTAGNCALQFYWYSAVASQTYVSCADIVMSGGGTTGGATTPAAMPSPPAPKPTPPSVKPTPPSVKPTPPGVKPATPAANPITPYATPAPSSAPPSSGSVGSDATLPAKKSCKKRVRRN
jgi:hypothetical protein